MIYQHIIHRMLVEEIIAFKNVGLNPNKIVMSLNILNHMKEWEYFEMYYTPAGETIKRAKYYGLDLVVALEEVSEDVTKTPGACFVCCAASSGKLKGIIKCG